MDALIARLLSTLAALGTMLPHANAREEKQPTRIVPVLFLVGLYAVWCMAGATIMVCLLLSGPNPYRANVAPAIVLLILWIVFGSIWLRRLAPSGESPAERARWLEPRLGPIDLALIAAIAGALGWALVWP